MDYCAGPNADSLVPDSSLLAREAEEKTQQPDLHKDFGDIFFFRALRSLFIKAEYDSFSLSDLYAPTPKRIRVQLSALLNFALFCTQEENFDLYKKLNEEVSHPFDV